ncbi:MAG: NHL repeat-containing protein [Spirochaetales bacterium]|nr:NHL repeat-containing protein [Spirochaetales bacterium]
MKKITNGFLLIFLLFIFSFELYAQIDLDEVDANHEFQWGVISYHRGEFNESILSLEKSLSLKPYWEKTKLWLGHAHYRAGFTDAAIAYWTDILEKGGGSIDLRVKVDNIKYLRTMGPDLKETPRYVFFHEIFGVTDEYSIFKRPSSGFPTFDGGFYLSSFATNEVQKFSVNGVVKQTFRGGLSAINHPFDIIETKDYLFISEYSSDRIIRSSKGGKSIFRFGSPGSGSGELLGPQFFTDDGENHIYVTESGNGRVSKFDYEGNFIFSFGKENEYFNGFKQPTGIIFIENKVLVADGRKKELYLFDSQGNYIKSYKSDLLIAPEGISSFSENEYLIADGNRIILFNIYDESFRVFAGLEQTARLMKAFKDINGNIVAIDFNGNKVTLLTDYTRMYTGLNLSIDRILSDDFPNILVELTISTVDGSKYVGLEENNFLLAEDSYTNSSMSLISSGNKTDFVDISYLVEGSDIIKVSGSAKVDAMKDLLDSIEGRGVISIITAEEIPVLDLEQGSGIEKIKDSLSVNTNYSKNWSFDLGMRLASTQLIGGGSRKAVIFLSSGKLNQEAFSHYSLTETLDYLNNNGIVFYTVYVNDNDKSPELEFLSKETGGLTLPLYGPSGINAILPHLRSKPSGSYTLKFRTERDSDFGRRALPVEVQVSHFDRSGKDRSVYYGPGE